MDDLRRKLFPMGILWNSYDPKLLAITEIVSLTNYNFEIFDESADRSPGSFLDSDPVSRSIGEGNWSRLWAPPQFHGDSLELTLCVVRVVLLLRTLRRKRFPDPTRCTQLQVNFLRVRFKHLPCSCPLFAVGQFSLRELSANW